MSLIFFLIFFFYGGKMDMLDDVLVESGSDGLLDRRTRSIVLIPFFSPHSVNLEEMFVSLKRDVCIVYWMLKAFWT